MSDKNNGGPAFWTPVPDTEAQIVGGMTLRDYFAAKALPALINENVPLGEVSTAAGLAANVGGRESIARVLACAAYQIADAMLAERAK